MSTEENTPEKPSNQFVNIEHEILKFWEKESVFAKTLEKNKDLPPYWYYDGPPFATGLPHHGHLLASTIKDIVPRYFEMQGHSVPRHFGWDCHGVPIEHAIDKDLGLSTEQAIEKLGLEGYNQACRSIVQRYSSEWEKTITRIGRWANFSSSYKTMDKNFMESVWWAISELWEKDLVYQGVKVVPYSTKLQTPLSNFEATSNYQNVQNPAITVLFQLKGMEEKLAIWTTTPWTLPSNLAICIGPYTYLKVYDPEKNIKFIIAQDCLKNLAGSENLEIIEKVDSSELEGLSYEPIFPFYADQVENGAFRILLDDYVTTTDGTGLVHCAPAHGEDDYRVCQNASIPVLCPLDNAGVFDENAPDFKGLYVKDADKVIIKQLKNEGKLYHHDVIVHNYPFCPRTDTPLIYRTIPSWYVKVTAIKEKLIVANNEINWVPKHIKQGRFGKWLENAKDWAISRNRYWGTPIPIWVNDVTGNKICMDSIDTLYKYSGILVEDLHRENIDNITFTIDNEEGIYKRIPEVLDCWFESGSMPFAQLHYPFENKDTFEKLFPATFIAEGIDQTRGWFYTLTVMSAALFDKPAFKNVIVNGIVMAEDGKKMSKRLKNYTAPDILLETYGADALRLYLVGSKLVHAEEQRFCDNGLKDMARRVLLPWYNAYSFFNTYASIDNWKESKEEVVYTNILDQWIQSRIQSLIIKVDTQMQSYNLQHIVPSFIEFLDDLTNTYIRLNRGRFWSEGMNNDKQQAYQCLYDILMTFSKIMAPFTPFLSEKVFQSLKKDFPSKDELPLSIHMCSYPKSSTSKQKEKLEKAVSKMQQILILGRQKRTDVKIKIKIPLNSLTIIHSDLDSLTQIEPLYDYIKRELNIKNIIISSDESKFIKLYAKGNSVKLGKKLKGEFKLFQEQVTSLSHEQIISYQENNKIKLGEKTYSGDDILIFREPIEGSEAVSNSIITIAIDLVLNDELRAEGTAREMVNRIQKIRKDLDFNVSDRIDVAIDCQAELANILANHLDYIKKETLSVKWEFRKIEKDIIAIKIEDHSANISIRVVEI